MPRKVSHIKKKDFFFSNPTNILIFDILFFRSRCF